MPVMTRVSPEVKRKLRAIAKQTERSESYLAREAIEHYVAVNDWQAELIASRLAEAQSGGEKVSHETAMRWLDARAAGKKVAVPRGRR
jgi:predicted transcriptional regulator